MRGCIFFLIGSFRGQVTAFGAVWALLVCIGAYFWHLSGGANTNELSDGVGHAFWASWVMFIDIGTQTGLHPDEDNMAAIGVAVTQSLIGFMFLLVVLGVVCDGVRGTIDRWQVPNDLQFRDTWFVQSESESEG